MKTNDTIAAISTPAGEGGIGVIRITGPTALQAGLSVFSRGHKTTAPEHRRLYFGEFKNPQGGGAAIDRGFFVFMKGPASYTGEDTVELHAHGSMLVLKRLLEAVLKSGARLAEPGEFTKRAFLNGKIDLIQAEAVIDVIRAATDGALSAAAGRLDGRLSKKINHVKQMLTDTLARIEALLDFPEDDTGAQDADFVNLLFEAADRLKKLLLTSEEGMVLKNGVRTLILGRPNAGKSSLLNVLLEQERALVTEIPGTTRDFIEEAVNIRGMAVRLIDTAGLRDTKDRIESMGVRAAKDKINAASLIIYVVDASASGFDGDKALLTEALGKKIIIAANKTDIAPSGAIDAVKKAFDGFKVVFISALKETGIDELKDAVFEEAAGRPFAPAGEADPGELLAAVRHREAVKGALTGLERALSAFNGKSPLEFVAADLRESLSRLGEITGETTAEDILDRIFSEFCIGK